MDYHVEKLNDEHTKDSINDEWETMASFENSVDRDDFLDLLRGKWGDCKFRPADYDDTCDEGDVR